MMAAALAAELLPVRPYPFDVTAWGPAVFDAVAPLVELLGFVTALDRIFVEEDGVVVRLSGRPPFRPTPAILLAPARLLRTARRYDPTRWQTDPLLAGTLARARALEVRQPRALSWEDLLATLHEALAIPRPIAGELRRRYFPRAALATGLLRQALGLLGRADRFGVLLSGVENKTLEANQALEALAVRIRSDPTLAAIFARHEAGTLWAALEAQPSSRAFVDALHAFLDRYGHREAVITSVSQPTWKDAPEVVLGLLKGLALAEPRPRTGRPACDVARDELLAHPLLRLPPLRSAFLARLAQARCLLQIREDTHFYATLALPIVRRTVLELGERLGSAGVLDRPEDVFHLKLDELERVDGTWPPPAPLADELRAAALRRKQRRAALEGTPLMDPRLLRPTEPDRDAALQGNVLLHGMPGSPGVAEGPVRVIRDGTEFGTLRSGEVLVAPHTNPAWTPLFQRAVAVVVDSGGAGSHAAIVAREYGIPAVMATVDGTQRLKDGQRVRVDGSRGLVLRAAPRTTEHAEQPG
jgi:pyruvate,water dikinase